MNNMNTILGLFANAVTGLIFIVGFSFLLRNVSKSKPRASTLVFIVLLFVSYITATEFIIAAYLPRSNKSVVFSDILTAAAYFTPFFCLFINYIFSYRSVLKAQHLLEIRHTQLEYFASHDTLTNLYNRREFENLIYKIIGTYAREKQSFALFMIDIDNFKIINDTRGHNYGDEFLKKFANKLTALTRQGDFICRMGGDEFTILMPSLKSATGARKLATRILNSLSMPYSIDEKLLMTTVSIGIAIYPLDGDNAQMLLKNADLAMYIAKKSGKKTYQFYNEKIEEEQKQEAEMEAHLINILPSNKEALVEN